MLPYYCYCARGGGVGLSVCADTRPSWGGKLKSVRSDTPQACTINMDRMPVTHVEPHAFARRPGTHTPRPPASAVFRAGALFYPLFSLPVCRVCFANVRNETQEGLVHTTVI